MTSIHDSAGETRAETRFDRFSHSRSAEPATAFRTYNRLREYHATGQPLELVIDTESIISSIGPAFGQPTPRALCRVRRITASVWTLLYPGPNLRASQPGEVTW